jgi:hypothetical protein
MQRALSPYWKCQLAGWSLAAAYWAVAGYLSGGNFIVWVAIIHFMVDIGSNILLTHAYRSWALRRNWHLLQPGALVWRIIPAIVLMAGAFGLAVDLRFYLVSFYFDGYKGGAGGYIWLHGLTPFMTGLRMLAIWVLAWHLYHYAQREMRMSIISKDARLNNLAAQLNPHFFFNSLNNIKALVAENPVAARRAIDLLSELLRTALNGSDALLIPLKDELGLVKDYLELEKLRYEQRLGVSWQVDDSLMEVMVLPLSIQGIVENAIKHGIARERGAGMIGIIISRQGGLAVIRVDNPGILQEKRTGVGIRNLRQRLEIQYQGRAQFALAAQEGQKVLATLSIPLV